MRTDPLKRINNQLFHSKKVLLLTDGKDKPQISDINLLKKRVGKVTTRTNINRSTRQSLINKAFCLVLTFKNGEFIPHPEYQTV